MKRYLLAAAAAVALQPVVLAQSAGRERWIKVENRSDYIAFSIFAKSQKGSRSQDLLGTETIEPGKDGKVNFADGSMECTFDIVITSDELGLDWIKNGVDVCREPRTIRLEGRKATNGTNRKVMVYNNSSVAAYSFYIIPSKENDCCWSRDLLGVNIIEKEKHLEVTFDGGKDDCDFDIKIISDPPGKGWTQHKFNACKTHEIKLKDGGTIE